MQLQTLTTAQQVAGRPSVHIKFSSFHRGARTHTQGGFESTNGATCSVRGTPINFVTANSRRPATSSIRG